MTGKAAFTSAMEKNICGIPEHRIRRGAVADSIRVFPMRQGDKLYGAVISGEHQFFHNVKGKPEQLEGRARFTHMLLLKDGAWKVSRVLSYDHGPAEVAAKTAEVQLAAPVLQRLAGTYTAKDKMVLVVEPAGKHLMVNAGGTMVEMLPSSATTFFMQKRDIKVEFSVDQDGKGQRLVARERGAVVAEATVSSL
jgi:hypothetical protein